jgi:hypothetical protein
MNDLTNKWYQAIRVVPEDSEEEQEPRSLRTNSTVSVQSENSRTNMI